MLPSLLPLFTPCMRYAEFLGLSVDVFLHFLKKFHAIAFSEIFFLPCSLSYPLGFQWQVHWGFCMASQFCSIFLTFFLLDASVRVTSIDVFQVHWSSSVLVLLVNPQGYYQQPNCIKFYWEPWLLKMNWLFLALFFVECWTSCES